MRHRYATFFASQQPAGSQGDSRLADLVGQLRRALLNDDSLVFELAQVSNQCGDGSSLKLLFQRAFPHQEKRPLADPTGRPVLSTREVEILRIASEELPREAIAKRLCISQRTVDKHFSNIHRKLGVTRTGHAITRATALGYLDMDALDRMKAVVGPGFDGIGDLVDIAAHGAGYKPDSLAALTQPITALGAFLVILGGAIARMDAAPAAMPRRRKGQLARISGVDGSQISVFPMDVGGTPCGLAVVPSAGARQGFVPGRVLSLHSGLEPAGLNSAAVSESGPEGAALGSFCGARILAGRLADAGGLTFAADGSLLISSAWGTDAILAFRGGGSEVRRFAEGQYERLCSHQSGFIYATRRDRQRPIVRLTPHGLIDAVFAGLSDPVLYSGIAVTTAQHVFAARTKGDSGFLDEFGPNGSLIRSFPVSGYAGAPIAIDDQDRLYVPCSGIGEVKVLASDGAILGRYQLGEVLDPIAAVASSATAVWAVGLSPKGRAVIRIAR